VVTWRRALPWLIVFVVVALVGGGVLKPTGSGSGSTGSDDGRVTRVVDGDTIHVSMGGEDETVRYIGVDTPETVKPNTPVQCYGKKASSYNHKLVDGERVRLRFDAERRDRYGRLLAYVYRRRDGLFVNDALVRNGYATTLTIPPNVAHEADFRVSQRRARDAQKGLWSEC
jgi:micrococcal nuclease